MRQGSYLNVILTVNAVLLSGMLWVQIAGKQASSGLPALESTANAQAGGGQEPGAGIPNAASQRQKMLEALREIKVATEGTRKLLEGGKMRVEVTNVDQIRGERKN